MSLLLALVSWQDRVLRWWPCRWGHADTLQMTTTRLYVACATCGRQTTGWACGMSRLSEGRR